MSVGATVASAERIMAVVHGLYGPPEVLRVEDVERPSPKAGEVLVNS